MKRLILISAIFSLSACAIDETNTDTGWDTSNQQPAEKKDPTTPKVEQPTQPKPTEPKKEDPILEPSKREFVKVYRHQDYACAIDTNNIAICDKVPPKGPTSPELLIPLELENVEQMALGDHGYCVLTTYKQVDCYGYAQPILNRRFTFKQIAMSNDDTLCALGDYSGPLGKMSCRDLKKEPVFEDQSWMGPRFNDPDTQWASIELTQAAISRVATTCALDMQGHGHCTNFLGDEVKRIEGPFKQIFAHDYRIQCTLDENQQWSCTHPDYDPTTNRSFTATTIFEGTYKKLISSVCAINTDDRVICWIGEDNKPSQHKLVDPVGFAVRDFSHPTVSIFGLFEQETNYNNWCAISKQGRMVCAQDLQPVRCPDINDINNK